MIFHIPFSPLRPDGLTIQMPRTAVAGPEQTEQRITFLPAEWHPQSGVQLTWPHAHTDWAPMLAEVTECYVRIALEIALREQLLIVTPEPEQVESLLHERLSARALANIHIFQCPTNDTWARDHAFITLVTQTGPFLLDFCFNGWGGKFPADLDNAINARLASYLHGTYQNNLDFVLEGGSIESDGAGTILTTASCLLAPHRNQPLTRQDIEQRLMSSLCADRVIWLEHGHLEGDDTDGHIDTLARFCPGGVITYVQCSDPHDAHYDDLQAMELELRALEPEYKLIPLPMPAPVLDPEDGHRLPATYANFLIINGAVLMPVYDQPANDERARVQLQSAFPRHEIIPIDCRVLVRQHGSLHCCTMQYPVGVMPGK